MVAFHDGFTADEVLSLAASAELPARHPLARGDRPPHRGKQHPHIPIHQACEVVLGITEVHAHALPEGKLRLIRDLLDEGHLVAMVGNGTNDAPALALADVGITVPASSIGRP